MEDQFKKKLSIKEGAIGVFLGTLTLSDVNHRREVSQIVKLLPTSLLTTDSIEKVERTVIKTINESSSISLPMPIMSYSKEELQEALFMYLTQSMIITKITENYGVP